MHVIYAEACSHMSVWTGGGGRGVGYNTKWGMALRHLVAQLKIAKF